MIICTIALREFRKDKKEVGMGDKTIPDIIEDVKSEMCDNYCKFPQEYKDQEQMWDKKCAECPLNKLG